MAVEDLSRSLKNKDREDVPVLGTVLAQLSSAFSQGPTLGGLTDSKGGLWRFCLREEVKRSISSHVLSDSKEIKWPRENCFKHTHVSI